MGSAVVGLAFADGVFDAAIETWALDSRINVHMNVHRVHVRYQTRYHDKLQTFLLF